MGVIICTGTRTVPDSSVTINCSVSIILGKGTRASVTEINDKEVRIYHVDVITHYDASECLSRFTLMCISVKHVGRKNQEDE